MEQLLQPDDFLKLKLPSGLTISQDGKNAYFEKSSIRKNTYFHEIIGLNAHTGRGRTILEGQAPAISPDGKYLAFLQNEKIFVLTLASGSKVLLGQYTRPSELCWDSSSRRLAFTVAFPQPAEPHGLPALDAVHWIDRVKFKTDGEGLFDGTYRSLVIAAPNGNAPPRIVSRFHTDLSGPAFVREDLLAYLCILKDPDESDCCSVLLYNLTTEHTRAISGPGGPISRLTINRGGDKLACIAHDNHGWEATNFHIYILDLQEERWTCLTQALDRSVGNYVLNDIGLDRNGFRLFWQEDDKALTTLITDGYRTELYQVDIITGDAHPISNCGGVLYDYFPAENGSYLAILSTATAPAKLICIAADGTERMLWRCEDLSSKKNTSGCSFWFDNDKGGEMEGIYYPPIGEHKGMVLNIHGGPHYCHGKGFSYDIQLLAAAGYGTVLCNPAGSQGAGEALACASYHDWGGRDYRELMKCIDRAIEAFHLQGLPWAVMGGSYGGFMTNWMIGHTNRFCCAISERSTCNRYSQAGTSDCAFRYGMFEFDSAPWVNPQHYREHSPISYVKQVNTPVLLIHGDRDMNCPLSQSEEWYSALRLEKKEAYLAVFPGQYHNLTARGAPACRKDRYRLLLWWLGRYLVKPKEKGETPCLR